MIVARMMLDRVRSLTMVVLVVVVDDVVDDGGLKVSAVEVEWIVMQMERGICL